ncbi:hypothetical protein B7463_g10086, partial [Scytalidium lignicola]
MNSNAEKQNLGSVSLTQNPQQVTKAPNYAENFITLQTTSALPEKSSFTRLDDSSSRSLKKSSEVDIDIESDVGVSKPDPVLRRLSRHFSHHNSSSARPSFTPFSEIPGLQSHISQDGCIDWDGPDDLSNPMNMALWRKWTMTIILSMIAFCITFASSIFSTGLVSVADQFDVSREVSTLGISLFILGFGMGPLVWGPFSELYGRKLPIFFGFFVFCILQIPIAVAQNLETVMLIRFLGGVFGAAPLACISGALADVFDSVDRSVALVSFTATVFIGPAAGPIVGSFITASYLGWRWTAWVTAIVSFFFWAVGLFIVPETYAPIILQRQAKRLRHETKIWSIHSKMDEQHVTPRSMATKFLSRPIVMLVEEPILLLVTIYLATVYGILYLFFEAFPVAFGEVRGWKPTISSLPFIALSLGIVLGGMGATWTAKVHFRAKVESGTMTPEDRLPAMIVGGLLMPVGLFWFAWTSNPHIIWVPQVMSTTVIGAGIMLIFIQGITYIVDVYLIFSNSAVAANTMMRGIAASAFPLFATQMYHRLGVAWASSFLAFLTLALVPVPVGFYIYGARIRAMSKFPASGQSVR